MEAAFAPGAVVAKVAREVGTAVTPIRVKLSSGTRVNIEASAPAALVVAVLRALR